jgi:hypothetical protein
MPANLSPEYKAAEAAFRASRDPRERLERLREMLRTIPKHKGTEHLQADIKARIKELGDEIEGGRKSGGHGGPSLVIRPDGAAQIAIVGAPNVGKSELHARLTGSGAHVAPYPFTTQYPEPGMLSYEDVHFQLLDLPAVAPEHPVPWLAGTLQTADAALFVADLAEPTCIEQMQSVLDGLARLRVTLTDRWDAAGAPQGDAPEDDDARGSAQDPFAVRLPALVLANKAEGVPDPIAELEALRDLAGWTFPRMAVSARTGLGLGAIGPWLFEHLGIVRVYTKVPGHPAERQRPFTLRRGQTVGDVARLVHHDLVRSLRYARVWGGGFDGRQVGPEHPVGDRDVVELHV